MFMLLSAPCLRSSRLLLRPFHGRVMGSNTPEKPSLHEALSKVSWLLGKWRGEGCGIYPTIPPFTYGEEVIFDHVGQPMLSYNSRTWNIEKGAPMHNEVGWLRVKPGTSTVAFTIAQNSGLAEVEEGEVDGHKIHLLSQTVGRISFGAEPKVLKIERIYTLHTQDPDTMEMECFMETTNTKLHQHLHITYKKVSE